MTTTRMFLRSEPHLPPIATVGLRPTVTKDVAPCAVLLAIYIFAGIINQIRFQVNRRRHHKFLMSWALFGFCMVRVGTLTLRLAWATRPHNVRLAIVSQILTNAGILIVYAIDVLLSIRLLRALHPEFGWNRPLDLFLKTNYWALVVAILLVISFIVPVFYTNDTELLNASKWIQRAAGLYILLFVLIAPTLYGIALLWPRSPKSEDFGTGSMRAKIIILGIALFFTLFIAGFRTSIGWVNPSPLSHPAWYDSRACFYVIELGFEIVIIYLFTFTHFEKRFWIPNGSKGPRDYHALTSTAVQNETHGEEQLVDEQEQGRWVEEEKEAEKSRVSTARGEQC